MDDLTSTVEDGATSQVVLQQESDPTLCLGARTLCSARYGNTTREKLMAAASWSFCHGGFQATGVDTIARRAGTAKTSLYKHFGNKDGLIEAVLEREGAAWRAWFFAEIAKVQGDAEAQLLALFDVLELWFSDPHFFGCPFINAAGEFDMQNMRLRKIIAAHKSHLNGWIAAQSAILGDADPDRTVAYFTLLMDGAIVAAQVSGNASFAKHAKELAELHLGKLRATALVTPHRTDDSLSHS
ncbi:TetR/AcrR family transcriptional regulator [Roseinatronobacter sp.]|uniref:TetR/AcrR family transcriptional regulator n=1 Tax=Roseinatronobacter sp. TaxID=1945755 RepID=UPI0025D2B84C|nr:TetR/AcrR family transcriptional regulator [Roseibaca sp.]